MSKQNKNNFNFIDALFNGFKSDIFFPNESTIAITYTPSKYKFSSVLVDKIYYKDENKQYQLLPEEHQKHYVLSLKHKSIKNLTRVYTDSHIEIDCLRKTVEFKNLKI